MPAVNKRCLCLDGSGQSEASVRMFDRYAIDGFAGPNGATVHSTPKILPDSAICVPTGLDDFAQGKVSDDFLFLLFFLFVLGWYEIRGFPFVGARPAPT